MTTEAWSLAWTGGGMVDAKQTVESAVKPVHLLVISVNESYCRFDSCPVYFKEP